MAHKIYQSPQFYKWDEIAWGNLNAVFNKYNKKN